MASIPSAVVLTRTPSARFAVSQASRDLLTLEHAGSIADAIKHLETTGALVLIAEVRDANGVLIDGLLEAIHHKAPRLIVVVMVPAAERTGADVADLSIIGLGNTLVVGGADLRPNLEQLLAESSLRARRATAAHRAVDGLPAEIVPIIRYSIEQGANLLSAPSFAAALGPSEDTLGKRLGKCSDLTLHDVITIGRLIAAAIELESTMATVESVANKLGFAGLSGFCNQLRNYSGLTSTELRRVKGSGFLVEMLRARIKRGP